MSKPNFHRQTVGESELDENSINSNGKIIYGQLASSLFNFGNLFKQQKWLTNLKLSSFKCWHRMWPHIDNNSHRPLAYMFCVQINITSRPVGLTSHKSSIPKVSVPLLRNEDPRQEGYWTRSSALSSIHGLSKLHRNHAEISDQEMIRCWRTWRQ